jgi:DNA-binding MarR family transcriptional regulator
MPQNVDPDSFGFLVADLARLMRMEFDRVVADSGLGITPGEARTLVHAARAGLVRQNVLAERLGVEAMTVTGSLDRLEAKGLIRRIADPADRRAKLVKVTDAADDVLIKIKTLVHGARDAASAGLSRRDWEHFMTVLRAVRDNMAELRAAGGQQSSAA